MEVFMKTVEYLKKLGWLENVVDSKYEECERLRSLAIRTESASVFSDKISRGQQFGSRVEDCVIKIIALENEIKEDILKLIALKRDITKKIDSVEDHDLSLLLRLRYINRKKWNKIAEEMHYSYVHVIHNLHPKAIAAIQTAAEQG